MKTTKKVFDVLTVGELNVDLILNQLAGYPTIGKEILAHNMTLTLGSSAAIFACNLSTLGTKVVFLGKLGNDDFAERIISDLQAKNVDTAPVIRTKAANTGISVALNYHEDRAMVTYPGAMEELKEKEIDDEALAQAIHLHVSSVFLQKKLKPGIVSLFKRAKQKGLTTSLDPQWDPAEIWDLDLPALLPYVDIFLPNTEEFKAITRQNDIPSGMEKIKAYANVVVIKKGKEGAWAWNEGTVIHQPSFVNEAVIDCIGAGDSFNAGFIRQYIQDKDIGSCLEFAALTGAINTTAHGGTGAFDNYERVKAIARDKFNYIIA